MVRRTIAASSSSGGARKSLGRRRRGGGRDGGGAMTLWGRWLNGRRLLMLVVVVFGGVAAFFILLGNDGRGGGIGVGSLRLDSNVEELAGKLRRGGGGGGGSGGGQQQQQSSGATAATNTNHSSVVVAATTPPPPPPTTTTAASGVVPWIPKTSGTYCQRTVDRSLFKSQSREDSKLMSSFSFQNLCGGKYIEMGGYDGITYSNTYAFHYGLNWKGILAEANPINFEKLKQNRPDEIATVHTAVCSKRQQVHFVIINRGYATGIWEFADEDFRNKWWRAERIKSNSTVDCVPLIDILEEHDTTTTTATTTDHDLSLQQQQQQPGRHYFDFFSLDIEGGEYEVLKTVDFNRVAFGVIVIEASEVKERNDRMIDFLKAKGGYIYKFEFQRSLWFEHPNFQQIYKGVLN